MAPSCHRFVAAAAVLALLSPGPASASPLELFGFGGRSPGLVGTGVASTDGYESIYLNPAGLASVDRIAVAFGGLYGDLVLELDGRDVAGDEPTGTLFGAVAPLTLGGVLKDRVAIGLSVFVPTDALARARWPMPGEPTFAVLQTRSHVVAIKVGGGVSITPDLRVGVAVLTLAALGGGIHISTDASGRFISSSEQTLLLRAAPIVGAQYSLADAGLELGLTFRGESDATYEVNITNDLKDELPLTVPTLLINGTAQYDPPTLAAEIAWRARSDLQLTGHLSYYRWSKFPLPTEEPVEGTPPLEAPGFHDTVVPRVAAEWSRTVGRTALQIRGGYSFVMTPAPEMDGRQSLLDNHRHVVAAGLGLAWPGTRVPVRFDLWTQGHFLMARRHEKDPARFGPDDEMPFATIDTSGRGVVGGISMGVEL